MSHNGHIGFFLMVGQTKHYYLSATSLVFGKYEVGFNRLKIKLKVQTSIHEFEKLEVYSGFPLAMRTFSSLGI